MMSFMSLQYIWIVDGHDLLIAIGNDHRFRALSQALGHAGGVASIGALGAAHGIAHVAIHGRGLVSRRGYRNHEEQNRDGSTTHQYFFHSTPLLAVKPQIFGTNFSLARHFRCTRASHKQGSNRYRQMPALRFVKGNCSNYITIDGSKTVCTQTYFRAAFVSRVGGCVGGGETYTTSPGRA